MLHRTPLTRLIIVLCLGVPCLGVASSCQGGETGTETVSRCYPEGACPESMFEGGLEGAAADVAAGEKIFQQSCATCHGADGRGMKDKQTKHVDFTKPVWHAKWGQDAAVADVILKGRPPLMPPAALGEAQLRNVIGYLRSLKISPSAARPDGSGY